MNKEIFIYGSGFLIQFNDFNTEEITKVKLAEEVVDPDDIEMLEDLILAATNEALRKIDDASQASMSKITGGLGGGMF